jgi:hypothetical protein
LLLSRGTVIAWIADPFELPKSFANHMTSGDTPLVVVPPGTVMVAFPPRDKCTKTILQRLSQGCPPAPGTDRGSDQQYHLVLTEDGFWGVLDRTPDRLAFVLAENDLKPMARAERDVQARFLLATTQIVNVPYQVGDVKKTAFSRGEVFRRAEPTDCGGEQDDLLCVDFNLDSPTFTSSKDRLAKGAKDAGVKQLAAMQVPERQVKEFRIVGPIVPEAALVQWLGGKGGYEEILTGGAFASLRLADSTPRVMRCGTAWISETASDSEVGAGLKAAVGLKGSSAEVDAFVEAKVKEAAKSSTKAKVTLTIEPALRPIDLIDKNGKVSSFWAGRAKTCASGGQTRATMMVSNLPPRLVDASAVFLHGNFRQIAEQIAKSSEKPDEVIHQVKALDTALEGLKSIKPGGSPFGPEDGVVRFKCLSQALAFERMARDMMASLAPIQVRVAITVTSGQREGDIGAIRNFYKDSSCN